MGIERAATRWYLQRIEYEREAASLEAKIREEQNKSKGLDGNERTELEEQLAHVLNRLHALGPCPKAMMG
ncbi:MAG TPA: hypothetical protein VE843_09450 [Ktedonobacteraceae bacterium]|nr:hypothetical protein [Ktedonobacteraceae bacterium]